MLVMDTKHVSNHFLIYMHDLVVPWKFRFFWSTLHQARVHQRPDPQNSEWKTADVFRFITFDPEQIRKM